MVGNEFCRACQPPPRVSRVQAAFAIGLLSSTPDAATRLRTAVRDRAVLRDCRDETALLAAIAAQTVGLSVVEVRGMLAPTMVRAVRRVAEAFPQHPVVVWCDVRTLHTSTLLEVAKLNVADLIGGDADELPHALGRAIGSAMQRTVAANIAAAVGDLIPLRLKPVFDYALEHVNDHLDRDQLAATFGVSRRTLHNRLTEAGLPPTRMFLTWCRMFVAVALLEQPGHTLDSVAGQLDFNDGGVLANLVRRYTGVGIMELRRHGALASAADAFRRQVASAQTALADA